MATTYSRALKCYNGTDAAFRAWASFVHAGLSAAGWVQTADTGQINLATVTKPTVTNEKRGYEIWRMADSLQATKPVYLRIDYGSGAGAANDPGVFLKIGTASNGSGTITGTMYDDGASATATFYAGASSSTQITDSWTSGSTSRFAAGVMISSAGSYGILFGIERGKDSAGADDGTVLLIAGNKGLSVLNQMASVMHGSYSTQHLGTPSYMLPYGNPSARTPRIAVGMIIPFDHGFKTRRPGRNFVMIRTNDTAAGAKLSLRVDAVTSVYQQMPGYTATCNIAGGSDGSSRVFMRFD